MQLNLVDLVGGLDVLENLDNGIDVWVTVLNFLLKFAVPCFQMVGGTWSLSAEVVPCGDVPFDPLVADVVGEAGGVYW